MLPDVRPLLAVVLMALLGCSRADPPPEQVSQTASASPLAIDTEIDTAEVPVPSPSAAPSPTPAASSASRRLPGAALASPPVGGPTATAHLTVVPSPLPPSEPFTSAALTLRGPAGEALAVPVYVADTPSERSRGLMDRDTLPEGTGMVFRFASQSSSAFYMYRTRLPLSIAFYSADGRVLTVLDMEPCTAQQAGDCPLYDPQVTYAGALEVNQGFFDRIGLDQRWTVELPAGLPAPT